MRLLALLCPMTDRNDRFPYPRIPFPTSQISNLFFVCLACEPQTYFRSSLLFLRVKLVTGTEKTGCSRRLAGLQKVESRSTFCNNFSQPSTWFEARPVWFVQTYTLSVPLQDFYRALFPQNLVGRGSCTVGDKRLLYTDVNIYYTVVLPMVMQYCFYCLFTGLVVSWAQMIPLVM